MLISKEFSSLLSFWIFYLEIRCLVRKNGNGMDVAKMGNLFEEFQRHLQCICYVMY